MSTNYYLKRIPTEDEITQCHKLLDERKIECRDVSKEADRTPCLEDVLETMKEEIFRTRLESETDLIFKS